MTEEQSAAALRENEEEHKWLLKEEEDELQKRMQEEMDAKIKDLEFRYKVALQERDHKMALSREGVANKGA